jgi:phage terminase small subunit
MAEAALPHAPEGLGRAGEALWKSILSDLDEGWELDARELHLLERACRIADELSDLEAAVDRDGATVAGSRGQTVVHPALAEARQLRLAQLRLLSAIEMVDPAEKRRAATPAIARARRAAESRWGHRANLRQVSG